LTAVGYAGVATIAVHFSASGAIQGASLHEVNLKRKRGQGDTGSPTAAPQGPEEASVAWLPAGVFLTQPSVGKRRRSEASPGAVLPPFKVEVRQVEKRKHWGSLCTNKRARHTYIQRDETSPAVVYGRQKWIMRVGRRVRGKTAYTSQGRVVEYAENQRCGHNRRSTGFARTWRTPTGVSRHQLGEWALQLGSGLAASVRGVGGSTEATASAVVGDVTRVLAGLSLGASVGQSGSDDHSASDVIMGEASAEEAPTFVAAEAATSIEVDMGEAPQGDGQQSNEVSQEMELDDAAPRPCTDLSLRVGEVTTFKGGELRRPGGVGFPRPNGTYVVAEEEDQSAFPRRRIVHSELQAGPSTEAVQLYCGPVTAALSLPPVTCPVSAGGESSTSGAMEDEDDDEVLPDAQPANVPAAAEVSQVEASAVVEAAAGAVSGENSAGVSVTPSKPATPETSGVTSDVSGGYAREAVQAEASSSVCPQEQSQATPVESSPTAVAPGVVSAPASGPELTPAVARSSLSGSQPSVAAHATAVQSAADAALASAMGGVTLRETVAPSESTADDDLADALSGLAVSTSSRANPLWKDRKTSERLLASMAVKSSAHKSGDLEACGEERGGGKEIWCGHVSLPRESGGCSGSWVVQPLV